MPLLTAAALGGPAPAPAPVAPAPAATMPVADPIRQLRAANSTPAQRDEAARRLILQQNAAALQVLLETLGDASNPRAQQAVARAVASDQMPDAAFIAPLTALIGTDPQLTDSAIAGLSGFRDDIRVRAQLLDMAIDPQKKHKPSTRLSAIRSTGHMTDKAAARALVALAADEAQPANIRTAASDALGEMTSLPGGRRDAAQWQQWWAGNANLPDDDFERRLLEARAARLTLVEQRFDRVVREAQALLAEVYQLAPEKGREQILMKYLRSGEPESRAVGVLVLQDDFKNNRPIPAAAREELRLMVGDSSSNVRVMVAQALFYLNDPGARDALLNQLKQERDPEVRAALAEALPPMRDAMVVPALLSLLRDPSLAVAEVAARGLADDKNIAPLIRQEPQLSRQVMAELTKVLEERTGQMGTGALRVAIIDAMGALKNRDLSRVYSRLLLPNESVPVRRAALRALGKLEENWAADIIVNALSDPDEDVRMEALVALDTTANFSNADKLWDVMKNPKEKPAIREKAWQVLRNRFPDATATKEQLFRWADRFKEDPDKRIEVLEVLAKRLTADNDRAELARVQQNIGAELWELSNRAAARGDLAETVARAVEADKYFEVALQYYREKYPTDENMTTSNLLDQRMDALLTSKDFDRAVQFASSSIKINKANEEAMGRKLLNEADRLRSKKLYDEAAKLIDWINKMSPQLSEPFASSLKNIEADVAKNLKVAPQSAAGSGL